MPAAVRPQVEPGADGLAPLRELGERRRMIFSNVANGVPRETIMRTFALSALEVDREVAYVARKIGEYRFERRLPPVACGDDREIRFNRKVLAECLEKLGPLYLGSQFIMSKITVHAVDDMSQAREAAQRSGARVNT